MQESSPPPDTSMYVCTIHNVRSVGKLLLNRAPPQGGTMILIYLSVIRVQNEKKSRLSPQFEEHWELTGWALQKF